MHRDHSQTCCARVGLAIASLQYACDIPNMHRDHSQTCCARVHLHTPHPCTTPETRLKSDVVIYRRALRARRRGLPAVPHRALDRRQAEPRLHQRARQARAPVRGVRVRAPAVVRRGAGARARVHQQPHTVPDAHRSCASTFVAYMHTASTRARVPQAESDMHYMHMSECWQACRASPSAARTS